MGSRKTCYVLLFSLLNLVSVQSFAGVDLNLYHCAEEIEIGRDLIGSNVNEPRIIDLIKTESKILVLGNDALYSYDVSNLHECYTDPEKSHLGYAPTVIQLFPPQDAHFFQPHFVIHAHGDDLGGTEFFKSSNEISRAYGSCLNKLSPTRLGDREANSRLKRLILNKLPELNLQSLNKEKEYLYQVGVHFYFEEVKALFGRAQSKLGSCRVTDHRISELTQKELEELAANRDSFLSKFPKNAE
jgi:hypothetical protein